MRRLVSGVAAKTVTPTLNSCLARRPVHDESDATKCAGAEQRPLLEIVARDAPPLRGGAALAAPPCRLAL